MGKYKIKPIKAAVIEAHQWAPGDMRLAGELVGWLMGHGVNFYHPRGLGETTTLAIRYGPGEAAEAGPGDWIIRNERGAFYPYPAAMFEDTYELANQPDEPLEILRELVKRDPYGIDTDSDLLERAKRVVEAKGGPR